MSPSEQIDRLIAKLGDWRGEMLTRIRGYILDAESGIVEEWKWMGSPVWSRDGIIAVGNAHKDKVKLTFPHGAELADPSGLFNAGLGGKSWRAIDLFEHDWPDEHAFKELIRAAVERNRDTKTRKAAVRRKPGGKPGTETRKPARRRS